MPRILFGFFVAFLVALSSGNCFGQAIGSVNVAGFSSVAGATGSLQVAFTLNSSETFTSEALSVALGTGYSIADAGSPTTSCASLGIALNYEMSPNTYANYSSIYNCSISGNTIAFYSSGVSFGFVTGNYVIYIPAVTNATALGVSYPVSSITFVFSGDTTLPAEVGPVTLVASAPNTISISDSLPVPGAVATVQISGSIPIAEVINLPGLALTIAFANGYQLADAGSPTTSCTALDIALNFQGHDYAGNLYCQITNNTLSIYTIPFPQYYEFGIPAGSYTVIIPSVTNSATPGTADPVSAITFLSGDSGTPNPILLTPVPIAAWATGSMALLLAAAGFLAFRRTATRPTGSA